MKPLLAHVYEPHRVTYPCFCQPKLNGIRALFQGGHFQSRDELPFPDGLLDHLARPLMEIFEPSVILDGELYVHGWPLQRINAAVTPVRQVPSEDTLQVQYHVFDVVDFGKSFQERTVDLYKLGLYKLGLVKVVRVPTRRVVGELESNSYYNEWVSQGYEGMMYRLGDCPYTVPKQDVATCPDLLGERRTRLRFLSDQDNRVWHLLKRKDWQDDEFECIGVEEGEGKLKGTLGALTCDAGPCDLNSTPVGHRISAGYFSVGSGLTDAERDHYWQNPPIGRKIKVKYLVLSESGIPLNPTILAIL